MKNTKIILLSIISIVLFFNSKSIEAAPQGPGFEIYNKAPNPISIKIRISGGKFGNMIIVPSGGKFAQEINLEAPITLAIYKPLQKQEGILDWELPFIPADYLCDINTPGKTKYVTWNPAKTPSLYPQTGILMGLLGTSDSGYSLSNNIAQGNILSQNPERDRWR